MDELVLEAGLTGEAYDAILIDWVRVAIKDKVAMQVAMISPALTTYDKWKENAILLNQLMQDQTEAV